MVQAQPLVDTGLHDKTVQTGSGRMWREPPDGWLACRREGRFQNAAPCHRPFGGGAELSYQDSCELSEDTVGPLSNIPREHPLALNATYS